MARHMVDRHNNTRRQPHALKGICNYVLLNLGALCSQAAHWCKGNLVPQPFAIDLVQHVVSIVTTVVC